ncbi:MAG: MFS transporter [Chloroflexi bacterium]|nr:MFS transporter [Chloroflexota bacterium]
MSIPRGRDSAGVTRYQAAETATAAPPALDAAGGASAAAGLGPENGRSKQTLWGQLQNRTFSSLKVPSFRWFYGSMIGQMAAMQIEMVARGILVYEITGSGTILGVMALAQSLPMLVASFLGGVMADRIPKKQLMVVGMASNAVIAGSIALAIALGFVGTGNPALAVTILVVAGLFKGTVQGLIMPARQSIIPELVSRDQIMNAMALNNLGMNILRFTAPAMAGYAVVWWGYESVYYIMSGLFLVATFFATGLPKIAVVVPEQRTRAIDDVMGGFGYARREPTIALILTFTLFVVLCSMPYMMLLPVFTEDVLHKGAAGMGILVSVSGVGAIVCSLVLASLPNKHRGTMLIVSSLILGVALTVFAFSTIWVVSLVAIAFVGLGQTGRMTLSGSLLQHYVEDEYRGRVMAIYMMEFGLTSLSVFFAGIMADRIGIQWSIGGLAILLVVLTLVVWVISPRLRALQ